MMTHDGASTTVTYSELWRGDLPVGVTNLTFRPGSSGLAKLDDFARNWDQFKLKSCAVDYKTSTGTVTNGHFYMGVDYSASDVANATADVTSLENKADGPVWENQHLAIDIRKAMTKSIMYTNQGDADNTPFVLSLSTEVAKSGVIWCHYSVQFDSPKRDTTSVVAAIASAEASFIAIGGNAVEYGTPAISIQPNGGVSEVKTSLNQSGGSNGGAWHVEFDLDQPASSGDQYFITANAPASFERGNAQLQVVFRDGTTGRQLTPDIVRQVSTQQNGPILSAVWQFFKPYLKTFIIRTTEFLLSASAPSVGNVGTAGESGIYLSRQAIPALPQARTGFDVVGESAPSVATRQGSAGQWNETVSGLQGKYLSWVYGSDDNVTLTALQAIPDGSEFRVKVAYQTTGTSVTTVTAAGVSGTQLIVESNTNVYWQGWIRSNSDPTGGALVKFTRNGTSTAGDRWNAFASGVSVDVTTTDAGLPVELLA
jgi:hypothetical protein